MASKNDAIPIERDFQQDDLKRSAHSKGLKVILICICAVITAGVMLNSTRFFFAASMILSADIIEGAAARYLVVTGLGGLLDIAMLGVFIAFALSIVQTGVFFSATQTRRLLTVGVLLLLQVALGLLLPTYALADGAVASEVSPVLDLRLLSFSLIFFALTGIFEYGRLLKEDSDNVI